MSSSRHRVTYKSRTSGSILVQVIRPYLGVTNFTPKALNKCFGRNGKSTENRNFLAVEVTKFTDHSCMLRVMCF